MKKIKIKGFTLIELIVAILILAILSTITFISMQSYNKYTRNSVRLADLSTIGKALEIKNSQGGYMLEPANKVDITSSGSIVMQQGDFTSEMGKKIGIIGELKDPVDQQNYTYVVNRDLTRYELFAFTEGEIAYNPLSQPFPPREKVVLETAQAEDKTVITKGHKLGVLLTNENIPIQRTGTGVDILTTNTVFKAYLDNKEILNGTGGVLFSINPTASCKRILETGLARRGDKADGVYQVNPYGTSMNAYCDFRYPDKTFLSEIINGGFEESVLGFEDDVPNGNFFGITENSKKNGNFGFEAIGNVHGLISKDFTYVDSSKRYTLEGEFRSAGTPNSVIHYGFREYDKDFQPILNQHVNTISGTNTTLTQNIINSDTVIYFEDKNGTTCQAWLYPTYFSTNSYIAFDIDDSGNYNDLPNRDLSINHGFVSVVDEGNTCKLTLNSSVGKTYPAGTKIRRHNSGGSYNYVGTNGGKTVSQSWTKYSGEVFGESQYGTSNLKFRRGTKFVKILLNANYQQTTSSVLYVDDLKLTEE